MVYSILFICPHSVNIFIPILRNLVKKSISNSYPCPQNLGRYISTAYSCLPNSSTGIYILSYILSVGMVNFHLIQKEYKSYIKIPYINPEGMIINFSEYPSSFILRTYLTNHCLAFISNMILPRTDPRNKYYKVIRPSYIT